MKYAEHHFRIKNPSIINLGTIITGHWRSFLSLESELVGQVRFIRRLPTLSSPQEIEFDRTAACVFSPYLSCTRMHIWKPFQGGLIVVGVSHVNCGELIYSDIGGCSMENRGTSKSNSPGFNFRVCVFGMHLKVAAYFPALNTEPLSAIFPWNPSVSGITLCFPASQLNEVY